MWEVPPGSRLERELSWRHFTSKLSMARLPGASFFNVVGVAGNGREKAGQVSTSQLHKANMRPLLTARTRVVRHQETTYLFET